MVANWGRLATAAKAAGLKGMQFDAEVYHGEQLFVYGRHMKRSRRAYEARIEEVGARVMREVNKHYPDMVLLLLSGAHRRLADDGRPVPRRDAVRGQARVRGRLVDGYEKRLRIPGRGPVPGRGGRGMTRHAVAQSYYRPQYRQHVQAGFAVWPCNWHGKPPKHRPFDTVDFSNNHYTPDELAYTIQWRSRTPTNTFGCGPNR